MGCENSKSLILSELNQSHDALISAIDGLKAEKKEICQELDKFSYEETMIGRDIIELKFSLNSLFASGTALVHDIHDLPHYKSSVYSSSESLVLSIASLYSDILTKLRYMNELKLEKYNKVDKKKVIKKETLDYEVEILKLCNCLTENQDFLNNEKLYSQQLKSLRRQKDDLIEELSETRSNSKAFFRYFNKNKVEEKVLELNDTEVIEELVKARKKNENLEEAIQYHKNSASHDIGFTLNSNEKQDRAIREYNDIIKSRKERIIELKKRYQRVKDENSKLQTDSTKNYEIDDKLAMLNKIIEKCRNGKKNEGKDIKKLIRKKTFISSAEDTVSKARGVNRN